MVVKNTVVEYPSYMYLSTLASYFTSKISYAVLAYILDYLLILHAQRLLPLFNNLQDLFIKQTHDLGSESNQSTSKF